MRVNASPNHPLYWGNVFRSPPTVMLDGAEIDDVVEADDAEGYVVVVQMDGKYAKADETGNGVATLRLSGKVEFVGARI